MGTHGSNPALQYFKVGVPKYQNMIVKQLVREDESNPHDLGLDSDFKNMTWKAQATKKIDKLDFIEIEIFLCFKEHHQKSEKTNEWEKIF